MFVRMCFYPMKNNNNIICNIFYTVLLTVLFVEDYLEPVIDESGSGQIVLKQGKRTEIALAFDAGIVIKKRIRNLKFKHDLLSDEVIMKYAGNQVIFNEKCHYVK